MEESKKLSLGNNYEVTLSNQSTSLTQDVAIVNDLFNQELHKTPSLLDSLTGNSLSKDVQKFKSQMLHLGFEEKKAVYEQYLTAKLTYIRERVDAGVMRVKADYRQKVASHLMAAMDQLESDFYFHQKKFALEIDAKYDDAKKIRNERTRKKFEDMIDKHEDRYFEFLDGLVLKFQAIVNRSIDQY